MPVEKVADYGAAILAIAAFFWLGKVFVEGYFAEQKAKRESVVRCDASILSVIEKNTKAFEQMTSLMGTMQVCIEKQDVKIDELLARARES